jgi:hypothetical protein
LAPRRYQAAGGPTDADFQSLQKKPGREVESTEFGYPTKRVSDPPAAIAALKK